MNPQFLHFLRQSPKRNLCQPEYIYTKKIFSEIKNLISMPMHIFNRNKRNIINKNSSNMLLIRQPQKFSHVIYVKKLLTLQIWSHNTWKNARLVYFCECCCWQDFKVSKKSQPLCLGIALFYFSICFNTFLPSFKKKHSVKVLC